MGLREILDRASQFQTNAGSAGLDLSHMPIRLERTFTFETADAFDGPKSPLWKTSPAPQLLLEVAPNSSPNAHGWSNAQNHRAQTFTPASTKTVVRVGLRLSATPAGLAPGQVTVELQSTTGSPGAEVPSGTVLAQGLNPKPANTIVGFVSFPPPVFFTDFDLPPFTLQAGVTYAIVVKLSAVNTSSATVYLWGENNDGLNHPGGRALQFNVSSQQWEALPPTFIDDYDFRVYEGVANPEPVVAGGFLQFDYPSTDTAKNLATIYDSPRGSFELETRFFWTILASTFRAGLTWGLHVLQGPRDNPPISNADKEARLLWECYIRPAPDSNNLSFVPFMVDASGQRRMFSPSSNSWINDPGPGGHSGFFVTPINNAQGIPITFKVQRQADGGLVMLAYKNDDPGQVIFQTQPSPAVRELPSGDVHLLVGHSPEVYGSRFRFDYMKLSGDVIEPDSGEVVLRRSYPVPTKITGYRMERVLPAPGSRINVRLRAADTLETLEAAPFGDPVPGTEAGGVETGPVSLPAALFFDVKLEFVKASPSPSLQSFDFAFVAAAVDEDRPILLSLDELGPEASLVTSSEEGPSETANTARVKDGDPGSQWASSDATDGNTVTLQLTFIGPSGGSELRRIGALILRNVNVKAVRVHVGTATLFQGELEGGDAVIVFPELDTPIVQLSLTSTQEPNQAKRIGEVYAGRVLAVLPSFDSYDPRRKLVEAGSLRTLGGRLVAYRGKDKYASRWTVSLVDRETKDAVEAIFAANPLITFYPEPGFRPRDLFDVGWRLDEIPFPYATPIKTSGHALEGDMEEI